MFLISVSGYLTGNKWFSFYLNVSQSKCVSIYIHCAGGFVSWEFWCLNSFAVLCNLPARLFFRALIRYCIYFFNYFLKHEGVNSLTLFYRSFYWKLLKCSAKWLFCSKINQFSSFSVAGNSWTSAFVFCTLCLSAYTEVKRLHTESNIPTETKE